MDELFPGDSYQDALEKNVEWLKLFEGLPLDGPAWALNLKLSGRQANSNIAHLPLEPIVQDMLDEVYAAWGVRIREAMISEERQGAQTNVCMPTRAGFMVVEHYHHDRSELVVSLVGGLPPS